MPIWKTFKRIFEIRPSMKGKLTLSLLSIAAILLVSCVISVMEYDRMRNYVSNLISEDIKSINKVNRLSGMINAYNLEILGLIGGDSSVNAPDFDFDGFRKTCTAIPHTEQLLYSYSAYMLTSLELEDVVKSDFIDTRSWFFERLQPRYVSLKGDLDSLMEGIYANLQFNSATFERGFYRSMIPGIVAVGVGLLLVLMLLFFILSLYVKPVYRMLDSLNAYRMNDKKYTYEFDGDDQLVELNRSIREIAEENRLLRKRIFTLRNRAEK